MYYLVAFVAGFVLASIIAFIVIRHSILGTIDVGLGEDGIGEIGFYDKKSFKRALTKKLIIFEKSQK